MQRWGGYCTCPNGQKYGVGAYISCADKGGSLACEGGTMSECFKRVDTKWGVREAERAQEWSGECGAGGASGRSRRGCGVGASEGAGRGVSEQIARTHAPVALRLAVSVAVSANPRRHLAL